MTLRIRDADARLVMMTSCLMPLEPFPGSKRPWRCQCAYCGDEVSPRYNNVKSGSSGCQRCGRAASVEKRLGDLHWNWKGGISKTQKGYVREQAPNHPRSVQGYVPQHILVMESYLGRYLVPGETVHHRNGIKDDNVISNLELWASSHPSGQRVVDLLAWHKEQIALYQPLADAGLI